MQRCWLQMICHSYGGLEMKHALRLFYIFSLYATCTDIFSILCCCFQFYRLLVAILRELWHFYDGTPHKAVFLQMQVNWPSTRMRCAMSVMVKYSQNMKSSCNATLHLFSMLFDPLMSVRKLTNAQKTIVTKEEGGKRRL